MSYRDDEKDPWREHIDAMVGALDRSTSNAHGHIRKLFVGLLGFPIISISISIIILFVRLDTIETRAGLCEPNEVAAALAARHRLTREQDERLCNATCDAVTPGGSESDESEALFVGESVSATCSWEAGGVRRCSCACAAFQGGPRVLTFPATESR